MIGSRLKELRKNKGLTIKQAAVAIRISPSTYREWEHGSKISGEPYLLLANLFNVSLYYLLTGETKTKEFKDQIILEQLELLRQVRKTLNEVENAILSLL